jgi:2''-5'' RNA ligase
MKRTFLAIPIPGGTDFPTMTAKLQRNLQHEKLVNWSKTDHIHLTLKFVGDTQDQDIPKIIDAVQKVAQRHKPFNLDFNCTGIFGSHYAPRVMWLGMTEAPKQLFDLEEDILDAFDEIGFLRDRQNFVPHLTIGRIKTLVDKSFFQKIYGAIEQKSYIKTHVKEMIFYQSFLQPSGSYYKILKRFELKDDSSLLK